MATLDLGVVTAPPGVERPDDHVVLFGATGDLARRKLIPGLFHLAEAGLMPRKYRIVGTSRKRLEDVASRAHAWAAVEEFGRPAPSGGSWEGFASRLSFAPSDADDVSALAAAVSCAKSAIGGSPRRLRYLSVPPVDFAGIVRGLGAARLGHGARVILEKPFGIDLDSARALNATVQSVFDESQVFRIDHFLGKEAVQNLLALRFANGPAAVDDQLRRACIEGDVAGSGAASVRHRVRGGDGGAEGRGAATVAARGFGRYYEGKR